MKAIPYLGEQWILMTGALLSNKKISVSGKGSKNFR